MAESKIIDYDGNYVTFWYQRHEDDIIVVEKLHVYEFIQKLIMHIPKPKFKYIRFYGAYHNSTKIYISLAEKIELNLKKWRYKILTNFHIEPLIYPICREEMIYYKNYYTHCLNCRFTEKVHDFIYGECSRKKYHFKLKKKISTLCCNKCKKRLLTKLLLLTV